MQRHDMVLPMTVHYEKGFGTSARQRRKSSRLSEVPGLMRIAMLSGSTTMMILSLAHAFTTSIPSIFVHGSSISHTLELRCLEPFRHSLPTLLPFPAWTTRVADTMPRYHSLEVMTSVETRPESPHILNRPAPMLTQTPFCSTADQIQILHTFDKRWRPVCQRLDLHIRHTMAAEASNENLTQATKATIPVLISPCSIWAQQSSNLGCDLCHY